MTVDSPQPAVQRLLGPSDDLASPGGSSVPPAPRTGGAKVRILETATRLFYEEGIRNVGVDRLISEASVTKATFYKHYGSKDNLILAYIRAQHDAVVAKFEPSSPRPTPPPTRSAPGSQPSPRRWTTSTSAAARS